MSEPQAWLRTFLAGGELPHPASQAEALRLGAAARAQGLAGLLDEALSRAGQRWPAAAAGALRDAHLLALSRSLRLLEAARRARALLGPLACGACR